MAGDSSRVVRTGDRPDLIPIVTQWLWDEFWRDAGVTHDHVAGLVAQATADIGPNQTFVLLVEGKPVGTASLVANDLDERPDLTPWLAGVVVDRAVRGLGHAATLINAVEQAGREASMATLWLHTLSAERIYTRAGWQAVSRFDRRGKTSTLMRKDL